MNVATLPRYFVVSPFKTGTTSVEEALVAIGAGNKPMPYSQIALRQNLKLLSSHRSIARRTKTVADYFADTAERARQELGHLVPLAQKFDIFADAPFGHGHINPMTLKSLFPEARFVWAQRPIPSWIKSVEAWETSRPGLYSHAEKWQQDRERRIEMLRNMRRRRHNAFKTAEAEWPDDCHRVDPASPTAMADLAAFCGRPDPGLPFPHANAAA